MVIIWLTDQAQRLYFIYK